MIGSKWVFKIKTTPDGKPAKFKARLVAQGLSQKNGVDYDEVFAPVVRATTIRTLLCLAGNEEYYVKHLHVKSAFLNGQLEEIIYMKQPPGCVDKDHTDWGCRLNKSIYGLKQAAKSWYDTLNIMLDKYGFQRSDDDACLYKHGNTILSYIVIHVDDIIIAGKSLQRIQQIINVLDAEFPITDLGDIKSYLGIDITRNERGEFLMNQSKCIQKIPERTKLDKAKPSTYPMVTNYEKEREDSQRIDNDHYSKLIGALLYVAVNTRSDISAPVALLAQHITDWTEIQRICKYLSGTIQYELRLGNHEDTEQKLIAYADADSGKDKVSGKSNSGYLFKLFGGTVSWSCKKQTNTVTSSTEAEIMALSDTAKECLALRNVLEFMDEQQDSPTTTYEDNQSCISIIHTDGKSPAVKHINTKYLHTMEFNKNKIVEITYCPSERNAADILTKPLGPQKTKSLAALVGLTQAAVTG